MASSDEQKLMTWLSRCGVVVGSASYQLSERPELQVQVLASELRGAAADGLDWRKLYASIYEEWHSRRRSFPDMETMARQVEQST